MYTEGYIQKCHALGFEPKPQDELVELCKNLPKYQAKSYLQLLSHFRINIQKKYCLCYLENQTINDLWLIFYVQETSGKIWNESKKDWI